MNFLKNHPPRRGFGNINLKYSNLVNVLQRHLRTDRNREEEKKLKYEDYPLKAIFTPITDEVSFHQKDGFGLHISYFLYLFFASFLL